MNEATLISSACHGKHFSLFLFTVSSAAVAVKLNSVSIQMGIIPRLKTRNDNLDFFGYNVEFLPMPAKDVSVGSAKAKWLVSVRCCNFIEPFYPLFSSLQQLPV